MIIFSNLDKACCVLNLFCEEDVPLKLLILAWYHQLVISMCLYKPEGDGSKEQFFVSNTRIFAEKVHKSILEPL